MTLPHFPLYIDGKHVEGGSGQTLSTINPATGKAWATFACADRGDIDRAVHSARRALNTPEWRDMTASKRGALLYRLAELVAANANRLGELETTDSGKLAAETQAQSGYVADYYRYFAGLADKIEGATLPIDKPDMHVFTTREPIGVVVAVVPWNAQMFLTATKLGPALAAGCSIILKASELAPCAMLEFARLCDEAGFPSGVISVVTGDADNCAIPLTSHPDVDRIAFTGGPETARHVIRNSAENFAVTTMELGGKSPIVVFEDADLESTANAVIAGNFGASGQSCVAGSRVIVHESVKDELIKRVEAIARTIVIGDPLDANTHVGPLCTREQVGNIYKTLDKAREQGAVVHFGGTEPEGQDSGHFFAPTLVECRDMNTETLNVELFGPVMSLISFTTEEEAINMANDTVFGLGSGVFTQNLARAHRVSRRIHAGICWINTYRAISPIAPFGGYNHSGYGREAGLESVLDYTRTKTTWINLSDQPMANPFTIR